MLDPWRLEEGPEFAESVGAARARGLERFVDHLRALEMNARLTPTLNSEPFLDRSTRVSQSKDTAFGYEVWLYYRLNEQRHSCELLWIEIRDDA